MLWFCWASFFFRLYDRDTKPKYGGAKYYIKPLQEGGSIKIVELEVLIEIANKSRKELIFGMVDAVGDVSYLKVEELIPENIWINRDIKKTKDNN